MQSRDWTILERQGAREIWQRQIEAQDGTTVTQYRGEEFTEIDGERRKVDETRHFDKQTEAMAWLNGQTG
ncbi:MAG: hypothetical protein CML50_05160 [Rhodobacteraceae bacterium]|jgi:hypothetical protein|uniref:Uncharacterized protein n=1 Tax=Salipiger profundus TaxID=1229727 RepID=A0A1U7DAV8_9RHOB|nr:MULTISPECIES: hypothetical protein [Salipiger]APX25304.1 hypothetical protein Ga0080559_TMP4508 [Salipiger profundus]MAB05390.1 hypothetical protein [Paracoccaceae bacterium]GGA30326.1 hypothetical protein GCM10011326_47800 [Salipiger profundus]SFD95921.1 hypothetical protein SAMN05444415_1337 [Salipiger profundus]